RGWCQERREHPEGGGLPGAIRAEEAEDLAGSDAEVDTTDGFDLGLARLERAAQVMRLDHRAAGWTCQCHGCSPRAVCCGRDWQLRRSASSCNICTGQIVTHNEELCQPWTAKTSTP